MCGISGKLGGPPLDAGKINQIKQSLQHRGPDGNGHWQEPDSGICLIHTRLSVLDLSDAGSQPMHSPSGRYTITFNGEIYNYLALREKLQARLPMVRWRGHSDTETLLHGFEHDGIEATLKSVSGMFAFGLWDKLNNELTLARDRTGEKPLYYSTIGESLFFSSDIRAFETQSNFNREINQYGLAKYVQSGYFDSDSSVYSSVAKVLPGTYVTFSNEGKSATTSYYWNAQETYEHCSSRRSPQKDSQVIDSAESVLSRSIGNQMISDVPLGTFLSGGIDSSLIAALMQKQSSNPINTFCIGFDAQQYNEAKFAKAVANHLGTNHTELYISHSELLNIVPASELARRKVTVCLSGDGGDEVFYGYDRYALTMKLMSRLRKVPSPARRLLQAVLVKMEVMADAMHIGNTSAQNTYGRLSKLADKLFKFATLLPTASEKELFFLLHKTWSTQNPMRNHRPLVMSDYEEYALFDSLIAEILSQERGSKNGCLSKY